MVGKYPIFVKAGGGGRWDEILEYRVWLHPGGDDLCLSFHTYKDALKYSKTSNKNPEKPLVLVKQKWYWNFKDGKKERVNQERLAEWFPEWLYKEE